MSKIYTIKKGRVLGADGKYYSDEISEENLNKDGKKRAKFIKAHVAAGVLVEKKTAPKAGK